jgi:PGAP1-like protein
MLEFIKKEDKKGIILFVHGFIGGRKTWMDNDKPRPFIQAILNEKKISDDYDFAIFNYFTKITDLFEKTSGLITMLFNKRKIHKNIPVDELSNLLFSQATITLRSYDSIILIAHSMGGLVSKSFILKSLEASSTRVKLYISLAVPHNGSDLALFGTAILNNPQVKDLTSLGERIDQLNREWISRSSVLPETIYYQGTYDTVVPKTSSVAYDARENTVVYSDDDHFSILDHKTESNVVIGSIIKEITELKTQGDSTNRYDIFLAAAMAGLNKEDYMPFKSWITETVIPKLKQLGYKSIYYAGEDKNTNKDFSSPKYAFERDEGALNLSRNYILLYPAKVLSSVFIELGLALEKKKRIVLFIKKEDDLPFLARELDAIEEYDVQIVKYENDEALFHRIEAEHKDLFKQA